MSAAMVKECRCYDLILVILLVRRLESCLIMCYLLFCLYDNKERKGDILGVCIHNYIHMIVYSYVLFYRMDLN